MRDHFRKRENFDLKKNAGKSALHGVVVPLQHKMGKRGGGVPDRWEDYSNIGSVIEGTRFLAFKVPLKAALLAQVKQKTNLSQNVTATLFRLLKWKRKTGVFQTF